MSSSIPANSPTRNLAMTISGGLAVIPQEVVPFVGERLIGGAYPRLPCGRAKL